MTFCGQGLGQFDPITLGPSTKNVSGQEPLLLVFDSKCKHGGELVTSVTDIPGERELTVGIRITGIMHA